MNLSALYRSCSIVLVAQIAACGGSASAPVYSRSFESSAGGSAPSADSAPSEGRSRFSASSESASPAMAPQRGYAPAAQSAAPQRAYAPAQPSMPTASAAGGSAGMASSDAMSAPMMMPPATTTTVTVGITVPGPQFRTVEQQIIPAGGLLTAASVGDTDRRVNYTDYLSRHPEEREELALDMSRRVRLRVIDGQNRPVNDARITIEADGTRVMARTHADGYWDFYPSVSAPQLRGQAVATVETGQSRTRVSIDVPSEGDGQDITLRVANGNDAPPRVLDLGFLIDVTGSMGDELRYVNREVASIVQRIEASTPGVQVRVGATFYRDRTDSVLVQTIPFTTNVAGFAGMMQSVVASGGGDYPEDMDTGLAHAMTRMSWTDGPAARALIVIADAPPQHYGDAQFTYREAMTEAARRGIRILPVGASGANRTVEYLFRAMGAFTSTPYVYLTDDSGVGGPHMEADTDRVAVERFADLLTRMVVSDLQGNGMHEPGPLGPRG